MYSIHSSEQNRRKGPSVFGRLFGLGSNKHGEEVRDLLAHQDLEGKRDAYFSNILNYIPHLVYGRNEQGQYTVVNRAFADFAGKEPSEILGRTDEELKIFLNTDQVKSLDEGVFSSGQKRFIPLEPFTDHWGNLFWFQTVKTPMPDRNGQVEEVINVSTDVTRKVEVEQKLSKSELRYRSIFENNYSGIIVIDKQLDILNKNRAFNGLVGIPAHEIHTDLREFITAEDQQELLDLLSGLSTRNYEFFDIDIQLTDSKGNKKDTICFVRGLYDELLNFTEAVVTFQDMTELRKQQRKLAQSEQRFRTVVEHATEALLLLDYDNKTYVEANRSAMDLFGYTKEEFYGLKLGALSPETQANGESSDLAESYMDRAVNGEAVVYEWQVKRKDGDVLFCEVRLIKMPYPDRTIIRISVVDITERKKARDLLSQEKQKLQESNKELVDLNFQLNNQKTQLQEFAYIASHNLRAPAGNIAALLDFYHSEPTQENLQILLDKLDVVSKDLMDTINDLAEVVKIKNEISKDTTEVSLSKLIAKVQDSLSQVVSNKKAKVTVQLQGVDNVYAPRAYLESILLNLLSNALKYSSAQRTPEVEIAAWLEDGKLHLKVSDNGLGIDLARFGKKLFGLRKTFHRNQDSRGVGLFITKAQVESLGGSIAVSSTVDVGTTFRIILPGVLLTKP